MMRLRLPALLLLAGLLGGCAAEPLVGSAPPLHASVPEEMMADNQFEVYDPWEGMNRRIYVFNALFDEYAFLPAVNAYDYAVPDPLKTGVSNFFSNLTEIRNGTNGAFQGRPEVTGRAAIRFALNSTAGIGGFFDVATPLGITQQNEDFGQTLGRYGVGPGPYLVLPVLGPSSVRDASGLAVDSAVTGFLPPFSYVSDWVYFHPVMYVLYAVNQRHNISFRYYGSGSPFEYDLVRWLFTKYREFEVRR
jgi:phospholipid-binding lipoprotein MlaA